MIVEKVIDHIWAYGVHHDTGTGRAQILFDDLGLVRDQEAEYIILSGCHQPQGMPQALQALKELLDRYQVSYSFLSKEYCCGWMPLGQPAVMAKNEADIARSQELAQTFLQENAKQAQNLGAKTLVLFCAACEPTYRNYQNDLHLEVIPYWELLGRFFQGGSLSTEIDYYAGCYRFRRRVTQTPLNVTPVLDTLAKIKALKIHSVDNNLCCYIPSHQEKLRQEIKTQRVLTICTGCTYSLQRVLKGQEGYRVQMLPEILWESVNP